MEEKDLIALQADVTVCGRHSLACWRQAQLNNPSLRSCAGKANKPSICYRNPASKTFRKAPLCKLARSCY
jgi:hypothetical protein